MTPVLVASGFPLGWVRFGEKGTNNSCRKDLSRRVYPFRFSTGIFADDILISSPGYRPDCLGWFLVVATGGHKSGYPRSGPEAASDGHKFSPPVTGIVISNSDRKPGFLRPDIEAANSGHRLFHQPGGRRLLPKK